MRLLMWCCLPLVALAATSVCRAQDERLTPKVTKLAPPKPPGYVPGGGGGPEEPYIYKNQAVAFKLSPVPVDGVARYVWKDGTKHVDQLTYLGLAQLTDPTGRGIPAGQKYDVWVYEATDKTGKKWWLAFGVDPLPDVHPDRYGLYYSRADPTMGGVFSRWLFPTGTTRE